MIFQLSKKKICISIFMVRAKIKNEKTWGHLISFKIIWAVLLVILGFDNIISVIVWFENVFEVRKTTNNRFEHFTNSGLNIEFWK